MIFYNASALFSILKKSGKRARDKRSWPLINKHVEEVDEQDCKSEELCWYYVFLFSFGMVSEHLLLFYVVGWYPLDSFLYDIALPANWRIFEFFLESVAKTTTWAYTWLVCGIWTFQYAKALFLFKKCIKRLLLNKTGSTVGLDLETELTISQARLSSQAIVSGNYLVWP